MTPRGRRRVLSCSRLTGDFPTIPGRGAATTSPLSGKSHPRLVPMRVMIAVGSSPRQPAAPDVELSGRGGGHAIGCGPAVCVPVSHWAGIQMSQAPFALELVISAPALACISHIQTHTQKPLPWRGQTEAGEESNYASRCQLCSHGLKERKDFASDEVHVKGEGRLKLSLPYPARGQVHAPGARRTALTDVGGGGSVALDTPWPPLPRMGLQHFPSASVSKEQIGLSAACFLPCV